MTCTKEGKWSGDAPLCECKLNHFFFKKSIFKQIFFYKILVITCETPHVPPGSYVVGYDYNIHSSIEYHCDPGHILRGESHLKCTETGEWSLDAPICECK